MYIAQTFSGFSIPMYKNPEGGKKRESRNFYRKSGFCINPREEGSDSKPVYLTQNGKGGFLL